ncbi:MAG: glycosyl transferase family 2 [Frankiales bacterium]|nr:glycosyl transferase family 2 [Frankiales bacterium]
MTRRRQPGPRSATVILWLGHGLVGYTYVGYPLLMALVARRFRREPEPVAGARPAPSITVVVPALDEEAVIERKVRDTLAQAYPQPFDVFVVADGSHDLTEELARDAGARVVCSARATGKGQALNHGVEESSSELVCFSDANCSLVPGTLAALAASFADPLVGVVSGAKLVAGSGARGGGEGLYWRYEASLKRSESRFGIVMGAPGELCAVRRETFRAIPPGVVNDDYWMTCDALVRGWRVGYAPDACAVEAVSASVHDEAERRARIAMGTWQATLRFARLSDPRRGWTSLGFLSHRVLRNLVVPVLLPALFSCTVAWRRKARAGNLLLGAHGCLYVLGGLGLMSDSRALAAPYQFLITNLSGLRGGWRYVTGSQDVVWKRARRGAWLVSTERAGVDREGAVHG